MPYLNDEIFDQGLDYATTNGTRIDICSSEPATYAAVAGVSLGNKTSASVGVTEDGDANGRKVVVAAVTDGSVTGTGTATHYAITDAASILVATGALSASQAVTSGNTFTLAAFDLAIADAT
jgi:hypothetical protein